MTLYYFENSIIRQEFSDDPRLHMVCLVFVLCLSCVCLVFVLCLSWVCLVFVLCLSCVCLVFVLCLSCVCWNIDRLKTFDSQQYLNCSSLSCPRISQEFLTIDNCEELLDELTSLFINQHVCNLVY